MIFKSMCLGRNAVTNVKVPVILAVFVWLIILYYPVYFKLRNVIFENLENVVYMSVYIFIFIFIHSNSV